jgi:hypothetical protein
MQLPYFFFLYDARQIGIIQDRKIATQLLRTDVAVNLTIQTFTQAELAG